VGIAGAVVLLMLFGFYLLQETTLSGVESDIDDQLVTNESIRVQIADKQKFADLQAEAIVKETQLAEAYAGEVSFSSMLMDVSRVVPSDAYLDTLGIQLVEALPTDTPTTTTPTGLVGTITMGGKAVSVDSISVFLGRLEQVKGWVNPWANTITEDAGVNGFAYAIQVDLSDEVVTPRGRGVADASG
jgi:Tfp pilus assembly protein PilN